MFQRTERNGTVNDDEARQAPAEITGDREDLREESRSMSHLGVLFLEGTATGGGLMADGLGVKAGAEKIKDVLAPKDEGPKVELPPGAERE
jgi:hypothetical protein